MFCKAVFVNVNKDLEELEYGSIDEIIDDEDKRSFVSLTPEEEFWVHCSSLQAWADSNYDTALLDSYLAFPLLKRLAEVGDLKANQVFKEEIGKKLKSSVPNVKRFMIRENYPSYLSQEELFYSALVPEDAAVLEEIVRRTKNHYCLVFDFDELRENFFHINRGRYELDTGEYYFSAYKGHINELELLLDMHCSSIPHTLGNLTHLKRIYLYVNDLGLNVPEFELYVESVVHLKIFCFGIVILPNIFKAFPNLRKIEMYGDSTGLTQLIVDDNALEKAYNIDHRFKNVVFKQRIR